MKPPLVLLHGWGVNALIWSQILPQLETEFEVVPIDLPGYRNDINYRGDYTIDSIADEVLARAPEQAIWVGWSLGGTIAMAAALAQPARFIKLQLVSATPRFLIGPDWEFGVGIEPYESLADGFDEDYEKSLQKFLLLQVHSNDRSRFREARTMARELSRVMNQSQRPSNQTLRAGLKILSDTDLRSRLGDLKVKTQVIAGKNDLVVPVGASRFLFDQLKNGQSIQVFDAGHMPFLEAPSKYIEALNKFANSPQ